VLHRLNSAATLIQRTTAAAPRRHMDHIGLDVHKKTISYCVKDVSAGYSRKAGRVDPTLPDCWMKTEIRGGERIIERASDTDREMCFSSRIFNCVSPH
jgi:hypothetical protein